MSSIEEHGCIVSHRYPVYRAAEDADTGYLYAFFSTDHGQFLMENHSRGAAGRNRPLNANSLEKEKIPIPSREVQKRIVRLVRYERRLRSALQAHLDLGRELRSALIAGAVMGKIDCSANLLSDKAIEHTDGL